MTQINLENIKCYAHIDTPATVVCLACSEPICSECRSPYLSRPYCLRCAGELIDEVSALSLKTIFDVMADRRRSQRLNLIEPIQVHYGDPEMIVHGATIDVSTIGIGLVSHQPLPVNTPMHVDFKLPFEGQFKDVQAAVVRTKKIGEMHHIGLMFMNLGNDKNRLESFILNTIKKRYVQETKPTKWQYL